MTQFYLFWISAIVQYRNLVRLLPSPISLFPILLPKTNMEEAFESLTARKIYFIDSCALQRNFETSIAVEVGLQKGQYNYLFQYTVA